MDQIVTAITDVSTKLLPFGAVWTMIGIIVGQLILEGVYCYGSEVKRTSTIAMVCMPVLSALAADFTINLHRMTTGPNRSSKRQGMGPA